MSPCSAMRPSSGGLVHVETLLDQAEAALDAGEPEKAPASATRCSLEQHPGAQFVKGDALGSRVTSGPPMPTDPPHWFSPITLHRGRRSRLPALNFDFEEARRAVSRSVQESPRQKHGGYAHPAGMARYFAGAQRSLAHAQWLTPWASRCPLPD